MATIEVDGKTLEAENGEMLIRVTDKAGIYIPRFCYHDKLSVAANCRMCLVEVEKAPKPLPACATPVQDGMKVFTQSELAKEAQKGTMEFLLINHPLDCPVCDQGGECPLQDQALGYGKDDSRFEETKRVVPSNDIGPLVATEMTRCIHCTRCVRFGEEVAGIMEMGAPGRGEYTKIGTFLNQSVDSEVSGNMIDLCPVGALTSKPYRFSARSWELQSHAAISPHDCLGTNINVQTLRKQVERVLPIENPDVNDCWIADRDRYSYQAVNHENRLTIPMIRDGDDQVNNGWRESDWESALKYAAAGLSTVIESSGATRIGGLASSSSTLEEFHLFQKLIRAMGSENVDHRLDQADFRDDSFSSPFPGSELPIAKYSEVEAALLIGSNIRKEQPLLSLRLRESVRDHNAKISALNPLSFQMNFDLKESIACGGRQMVNNLAQLCVEVAQRKGLEPPQVIADRTPKDNNFASAVSQIADDLCGCESPLLILGALALQHESASELRALTRWLASTLGANVAQLPQANSAAGWLAQCLPKNSGLNATTMIEQRLDAYVLFGCEPELDAINGDKAREALRKAKFVVQISPYKTDSVMAYADVVLPMSAFTENAGTFVNCEGRAQSANAAAPAKGEARPGWKILRVIGNFLDLPGFDQVTLADVSSEVPVTEINCHQQDIDWSISEKYLESSSTPSQSGIERLAAFPMYRLDSTLRHAAALQETADNPGPGVWINPSLCADLNLSNAMQVKVTGSEGSCASLQLFVDERIPDNCAYVPLGHHETASIGGHASIELEKA